MALPRLAISNMSLSTHVSSETTNVLNVTLCSCDMVGPRHGGTKASYVDKNLHTERLVRHHRLCRPKAVTITNGVFIASYR